VTAGADAGIVAGATSAQSAGPDAAKLARQTKVESQIPRQRRSHITEFDARIRRTA
jgi:hypothetical protein